MYYTLCPYNKVRQKKENVIKIIIRKIHLYYCTVKNPYISEPTQFKLVFFKGLP